jgi:hypothetical protein
MLFDYIRKAEPCGLLEKHKKMILLALKWRRALIKINK